MVSRFHHALNCLINYISSAIKGLFEFNCFDMTKGNKEYIFFVLQGFQADFLFLVRSISLLLTGLD
jgi:hypothetical protein